MNPTHSSPSHTPHAQKRDRRIFLTGFMGSGKSTIGPILANTLGYSFADVDTEVEHIAGTTINQIFRERGEGYFRQIELRVLADICRRDEVVVALGGGTIANPAALAMVSASGLLVYLKSPPEKLFHRLRNKINRPLLFDAQGAKLGEEDLKDRVFALYGHREVLYERADITVLNGEQPVGLTVDEIVRKISRHRV